MKVLVTGGAGFIGSHLVEALVARDDDVTVLDDLRGASISNLDSVIGRIRFEQCDLTEVERFDSLIRGAEEIYHLAANAYVPPSVTNPLYDFELNLAVTMRILDAMRRTSSAARLIYASSAAVYGNPVRIPMGEDHRTLPLSPYGVHKLAAEQSVRVFSQLYDLHTNSLRFFATFGPRQRKQVVFDLIRKVEANPAEIEVHGDGTQIRDFVYVTDVVAALLAVAEHGPGNGEAYNVGTGFGSSIAALVHEVCRAMASEPRINWTGHVRPGDAEAFVADISALCALGFRPQVRLPEGVDRVVAWARESAVEGA